MKFLIPGQYPRSEKLIQACRDLDRGRISQTEFQDELNHDTVQFFKIQEGTCYFSTGLFSWQDLLRPFSQIISRAKAQRLKRLFETNLFWKILEVQAPIHLMENHLDDWIEFYCIKSELFDLLQPRLITLPFIFLFQEFSSGISIEEMSSFLKKLCYAIIKKNPVAFCFFEPTFGWREINEREKLLARKFVEDLKSLFPNPIYLQQSFFSITHELPYLYSLPFDGIGIDFYQHNLLEVLKHFPKQKKLLAGLFNVESTRLESHEEIKLILEQIFNYLDPEQLILTPNGIPEMLPRNIMDQKMEIIKCPIY